MTQTIVYTSHARLPDGADINAKPSWLNQLVKQANINNKALNISGVLSYKNGKVFQLIEGQPELLQRLFAKIADDIRHQNLIVLLDIKNSRRTFRDWSMVLEANMETSALFREFLFVHFESLVEMSDGQRDELIFFIDQVFYEVAQTKGLH
jgi:hypothetical protein